MDTLNDSVQRLRAQIASLESVLAHLKNKLKNAEACCNQIASARLDASGDSQTQADSYSTVQPVSKKKKTFGNFVDQLDLPPEDRWGKSWELAPEEYKRYGRQLIMPEIGLRGGLNSPEYTGRLSLTPLWSRTATA